MPAATAFMAPMKQAAVAGGKQLLRVGAGTAGAAQFARGGQVATLSAPSDELWAVPCAAARWRWRWRCREPCRGPCACSWWWWKGTGRVARLPVWRQGRSAVATRAGVRRGHGGTQGCSGLQLLAQLVQLRGQAADLLQVARGGAGNGLGHGMCLGPQCTAGGRQPQQHTAFVGRVAQALHQALCLQALEQWRQRARIQHEAAAQLRDGDAVAFPQHQQHQVLRVGQAQRCQQRLVDLGHGQRGGVQREAQLLVQRQPVGGWAWRGGRRRRCGRRHGANDSVQLNCMQSK